MFEGVCGAGDGVRARSDPFATRLRLRPGSQLVLQGSRRTWGPGATIYAQSEPADFVYQVASGVARTVAVHRDGRRIVHGFHLSGEIFGLERERIHHCSAEAVGEAQLVQCPVSGLTTLAQRDMAAAKELWMSVLVSRDRTAERFMYVMRGTAFEKLAYFLIDLAWRTRSGGRIDLPMSRYDIADYLGLSSETVSRTFTTLRTRGLISTKGRQVRLLSDEILRVGETLCADGEDMPRWRDGAPGVGRHPPAERNSGV